MIKEKKVIIITGGAGRIGFNLAENLLKEGNKVIISDNHKKKLKHLKKKILSKNLEIFEADLTRKRDIDKLISFSLKKFKKIDSMVCSAYPKSKKFGSNFEKLDEKSLREDLYNQLGSTIILAQRIIKYFLKVKNGNLIFISSIQGLDTPKFEHYSGTKMNSPIEYSAVKSGIISVTKYLAKFYKNRNLRINCVSPGGIRSNQPNLFVKKYKKSCNSKGLLDPQDISNLILFLISEKSKFIHGQNLVVDDGWSL